jgi:hypothetical protein
MLKKGGYNLIEQSIVIVILMVIMSGIYRGEDRINNADKLKITNKRLDAIERALSGYYIENDGRLPCPAIASSALGNVALGAEYTSSNVCATTTGIVSSGNIFYGIVPVRSLNLPDTYLFDGWGNRIGYAVDNGIATDTATPLGWTSTAPNNVVNAQLWYDAADPSSIDYDASAGSVATWYDKVNSYDGTAVSDPALTLNTINGNPVIRFDGANDGFTYSPSFLVGSNYSIFVMEQRSSSKNENYFTGGDNGASNANMHLGYRYNTSVAHAHWGNDYDTAVAAYISQIPRIHVFMQSGTGRNYYRYSLGGADVTGSDANTTLLSSYNNSTIGRYINSYYNGDIGEVIMYNAAITSANRILIENYLKQKWGLRNISNTGITVNNLASGGTAKTAKGAYTLISFGENGGGAYNHSGVVNTVSANADEVPNDYTSFGAAFVDRAHSSDYDDILRFKTVPQFQRATAGGDSISQRDCIATYSLNCAGTAACEEFQKRISSLCDD